MSPAVELVLLDRPPSEDVLAALETDFTVRAGEAATRERLYLDTFDALLRGQGLTLRHERGRLELLEADDELPREAVTTPPPDGPLAPAGLPPGPLGERIGAIVGPRALLPLARVSVTVQTLSVLDEMDKTVARLTIEAPQLQADSGPTTPLRTRLHVRGIRGYKAQMLRAAELVRHRLATADGEGSLRDEAVLAAGGVPGGISSKVRVAIEGSERGDVAAARVLRRLADVLEANLPGTIADTDPEFLHDLRVSVRRTRAVQRQLRGVFVPEPVAQMAGEFKWLQQVTGDSRDLDVWVLGFDALRKLVPERLAGDLDPLLAALRARRLGARRLMVGHLRSDRIRALLDDWAAILGPLEAGEGADEASGPAGPDAATSILKLADRRIRKVHRTMIRMGESIGADSAPERYHDLRKKGKELRYLLELFGEPLHGPDVVRPVVKRLKGLQDVLGHHQDREVQMAMLQELRDSVGAHPGGPAALMAIGVLLERLEEDAARARAEFAERFAGFAAGSQRRLIKATFSA